MKALHYAAVLAASAYAAPATAELTAEYPTVVSLFAKTCVEGELTPAAREQAIVTDGGWAAVEPTVNVPGFGISRAIDRNFDYSKPTSIKQWSRSIDGVTVQLVLATFPDKRRYPALCALLVPNVKAGWPYDDAFEAAVKAIGLKGKSTDLPHYFEYSGKVNGAHPVRAEIFGRSQAMAEKNTMHLYIAF